MLFIGNKTLNKSLMNINMINSVSEFFTIYNLLIWLICFVKYHILRKMCSNSIIGLNNYFFNHVSGLYEIQLLMADDYFHL